METDAELETGYGRDTPSGDNLCNDFAAGMAEGFLDLAEGRGDRVAGDDPDVAMADGGSASMIGNVVCLRRPIDAAAWPALTERIHAYFGGHLVASSSCSRRGRHQTCANGVSDAWVIRR